MAGSRFGSTGFSSARSVRPGASRGADRGRRWAPSTGLRWSGARRSTLLQRFFRARTQFIQQAFATLRLARDADLAAVVDESMRKDRPLLLRDELHQILFDLHRVVARCQSEAAGDARDVRVDDDADRRLERV